MMVEFREWLNKKYIDWRGDSFGNDRSISDFARWIGVSQSTLNEWMQGNVKPSTRAVPKIAAKYPDVYEVLGMASPASPFDALPTELQEVFLEAGRAALARMSEKGITISDPEGKEIMADELTRSMDRFKASR